MLQWLNNLRSIMEEQGINARRLSLKASLNPTAIRDILDGRSRSPRYQTIDSIAKALNVPTEQLMYGSAVQRDVAPEVQPQHLSADQHIKNLITLVAYLKRTKPYESRPFSHRIVQDLMPVELNKRARSFLTKKEKGILAWVAQGKTNDEIGVLLKISPHTVNMHLRHVYQKINANNRTLAVVKAFAGGLLDMHSLDGNASIALINHSPSAKSKDAPEGMQPD